jgi:hypothetical protein
MDRVANFLGTFSHTNVIMLGLSAHFSLAESELTEVYESSLYKKDLSVRHDRLPWSWAIFGVGDGKPTTLGWKSCPNISVDQFGWDRTIAQGL